MAATVCCCCSHLFCCASQCTLFRMFFCVRKDPLWERLSSLRLLNAYPHLKHSRRSSSFLWWSAAWGGSVCLHVCHLFQEASAVCVEWVGPASSCLQYGPVPPTPTNHSETFSVCQRPGVAFRSSGKKEKEKQGLR